MTILRVSGLTVHSTVSSTMVALGWERGHQESCLQTIALRLYMEEDKDLVTRGRLPSCFIELKSVLLMGKT